MPEEQHKYERLPGTQWSSLAATTAYLGEDHVLIVRRSLFAERYRRFYFHDIQAVIVRESPRAWILGAVLGLIVGVLVLMHLDGGGLGVLIAAGVLTALLLLHLAGGRACECHIQTLMNRQRIPTVGRTRVAERFLSVLRERITAAQGELSPQQVRQQVAEDLQRGPAPPPLPPLPPAPAERGLGLSHVLLMLALPVGAAAGYMAWRRPGDWPFALTAMIFVLQSGLGMAAAAQKATGRDTLLAATVWLTLAYVGAVFLFTVVGPVVSAAAAGPQETAYPWYSLLPSVSVSRYRAIGLFAAVCSAGLGLTGLLHLLLYRRKVAPAEAPPPTSRETERQP